ncbi:hypothetical protein Emtol_2993 [Emticicia oligotrophica DSM 17448]|uniref:ATP-binding protein n=1 Tax=Emticicia oligotrophica (strain DSM 17448 / CIP 109782 / MTCC 6937 / GPTSA100-15) TaxID=929562 RepID=A0ABN4ARZ4_EMTOG|nr:hypothetical protein [Emticicia oligotrophica]AFK04126.1 hypothetical protein Emtol_2993 [Emticicia oligotrophica DSM 17448]
MPYSDLFNLKSNPFRLIPAINPDEIIWAGFPIVKAKFEGRIKKAIKIPNSSLVLNWGEYGSGKTHAARYFGKQTVLEDLARDNGNIPYFLFITLPKGKSPIDDFFISIIDKIDISNIREIFTPKSDELFLKSNKELTDFIDTIGDNIFIKNVAKGFFNKAIDVNLFRRYLYGSTNTSDNRTLTDFGIQRVLNPDTDYAKLLAIIFSCLTFKKLFFSSIILWIDEFEDIAILTKVNGDKTNSFLRELLDNTPNNLLVFLNLTQTSLFNIEDLGEYISEAVKSRIKDRINFEIPQQAELLEYVAELLEAYRIEKDVAGENKYHPFNEGLIQTIATDLGNVSLRKFNEALGMLIELAEMENKTPIDNTFYQENKSDVIGWKE